MLKQRSLKRLLPIALLLAMFGAACGSTVETAAVAPAAASVAEAPASDDAMADDEDAMADDAMADEEDAMADDAMADEEDAMTDDAMADEEDAMTDDAMADEDDAMTDDAMADEDDAMTDDAMADDITPAVAVSFDGLEPLGDGFVYEGWAIIDGSPVSTGRFSVEADGQQVFHTAGVTDVTGATTYVLTIEPAVGDDPAPAAAHVLAGDFVDGVANLTVAHPAALGDDFSSASGQFVLATPTTATTDDELSGIWFIDIVDGAAATGLDLPELPDGWVYEGWAVIDGQPVTTGRFTDPNAADDFNGFSGNDGTGPNYPGEDFIQNAPDGLSFPLDLTSRTVVISVEPADDDSPAPFAFKPLAAVVPDGIGDHQDILLGAGPGFPTGTASIG